MEGDSGECRAKRKKLDKTGRFAALQRLRDLKGSKNKYEVSHLDNVYEIVDEKEYTKKVLSRQDEDWIVDDNGSGYVEDGREIFDDDLDSESIAAASSSKNHGRGSRKRKAVSEPSAKGNLQYMLSNMPTKKKEEVNLDEDDVLSELIQEIDENKFADASTSQNATKLSILNEKQAAKNYMKSFSMPKPPKPTITPSKINKIIGRPSIKPFKSEKILLEVQQKLEKNKEKLEETIVVQFDNDCNVDSDEEILKTISVEQQSCTENITLSTKSIEEIQQTSSINISQNTSLENSMLDDDFDLTDIDYDIVEKEEATNETITEEQLMEGWNTMQKGCCNDVCISAKVDSADLPVTTDEDGKKIFKFFWWDAFEDRRTQPGVVFLFGKTYCETTKNYVSCCVAIRNILRKIFLLPRATFKSDPSKQVTLLDVYHEFNNNAKLDTFKSKKTTKNYPFDPDVPLQSDYLEVRYSAKSPPIAPEYHSGETYSKIFGLNTSYLEIILLERKIKGPCWMEIADPEAVTNPISWCKYEINCTKALNLRVHCSEKIIAPPPLTVASLNMRTIVSHSSKSGAKNEIVMLSCLVHTKYAVDKQAPDPPFQQHFCIFARPDHLVLPVDMHSALQKYKGTRVQKMDSEKALLNYFISQFNNIDPDLIVGHDLQGYQLDLLCHRLRQCGINSYSKLGKLKRGEMPHKGKFEREVFCGRLVSDIKVSARELIKSRSYDLDTLCQTVLKLNDGQRLSLEPEEIPRMYQSSSDILKLITLTMQDTAFILKMMYDLNVIPLALQITNIAGNVMSRTLLGGRSERNEFLLLHAFTEKDYLVPDKVYGRKNKGDEELTSSKRKKPTYAGGLVLDPKVGFYDKFILLMDFNSLYPSIIQEYNVCFTTLIHEDAAMPTFSNSHGVLPAEIRKLVESRREVKKMMKNTDLNSDVYMQYHIRQMALKLTANSMYGCLGFSNSRFFAKELAAFITQKGREILINTKETVEKMSFEVIYGDTDSIMINTNCLDFEQVFKVGNKVKQEINKLYKQVELDIDGVFKYLLLLKKKKYAAVTVSKTKSGQLKVTQEHKGLDIVRRDWSQLSSEAGKVVLNHILSDQTLEEKIENIQKHLTKLKEDLETNSIPLSLLVITKQLTKNPKEYTDKNSLTHVQVAVRYNSKGGKQLQNGDTVHYIICEDGSSNSATQRGYHVEEFKNDDKLKLDVKYYLAQQIHPVISRLCEPIPGLDAYQIADWLDIQSTNYKKPKEKVEAAEVRYNYHTRYNNCEPFVFVCYSCKAENKITNAFMHSEPFLLRCANVECTVQPIDYLPDIINQFSLTMRKYITKFYSFDMSCEDPSCVKDTNFVTIELSGKYSVCTTCEQAVVYQKYAGQDLHLQLAYFQTLFDLVRDNKKILVSAHVEAAYSKLKNCVDKFLRSSTFNMINMGEMFGPFIPKKADHDFDETCYMPEMFYITEEDGEDEPLSYDY